MKLRTQLILLFLVLALVPLSAVVLSSYWWDLTASTGEAQEQCQAVVDELSRRLASRRAEAVEGGVEAEPGVEIQQILAGWSPSQGEIVFAIDRNGALYFANDEARRRLSGQPLVEALATPPSQEARAFLRHWVVKEGAEASPRIAVALPVAQSRGRLRLKAVRTGVLGVALVGLSMLAVLPLLRRLTRSLDELAVGAERLARGDLAAQVPVRSSSELGRLARAFNRMAGDLEENQRLLLAQEGERREQEVSKRVLEAENDRQSRELEEARRFQLSLLPRTLPKREGLEVAVAMRTATQVGGDYYDFDLTPDGVLTVAVGDATGHGATAGRMVTVLKSLFTAQGGRLPLNQFLDEAAITVRRMELGRVMMALCLARLKGHALEISSAAMPPLLIYRAATARVEEVLLEGMPLGGLTGLAYPRRTTQLEAGDAVLMMSDGFAELPSEGGELLGYPRAEAAFQQCAHQSARRIIASLLETIKKWNGGAELPDDVTFVVLKLTSPR